MNDSAFSSASEAIPSPDSVSGMERFGLDSASLSRMVSDSLLGCDDGELFVELSQSESLVFDNGRLKHAGFSRDGGFGLRGVLGEVSAYAHSGEFSEDSLRRASEAVSLVRKGKGGVFADAPIRANERFYGEENPISSPSFEEKARLLERIDSYARSVDSRVCQVSASLSASWRVIEILRPGGERMRDVRPLTRLNVSLAVEKGKRRESGSFGMGGRKGFEAFISERSWSMAVDEALRQALVNLEAVEAPAGSFDVVLGPGWPGVMLHEAVGHGLEGDFNRKGSSTFSGRIGERVASRGVTVVDDATLPERRGSLSIDDEGSPGERTVLIEDGILVGYMQDRQNARLMGVETTGNGRRESFAHAPMPRMTNTCMLAGDCDPEEIIASVSDGIYAASFGGGQVDITSGNFVFNCTEAWRIRDGKKAESIKGANLIGNGPEAMSRISMIGNDMELDRGVGTCGKNGQSVPVGVGQPTLLMRGVTVGGTAA